MFSCSESVETSKCTLRLVYKQKIGSSQVDARFKPSRDNSLCLKRAPTGELPPFYLSTYERTYITCIHRYKPNLGYT